MRLDKYLKVTRLIKRRTVANEACDNGRVTLNGKVARASAEVKPGDIDKGGSPGSARKCAQGGGTGSFPLLLKDAASRNFGM